MPKIALNKLLIILLLIPMVSFGDKGINVQGHGCFYFPDEMTDDEIAKIIEKTIVKYNIKSVCSKEDNKPQIVLPLGVDD